MFHIKMIPKELSAEYLAYLSMKLDIRDKKEVSGPFAVDEQNHVLKK